MSDNNGTGTGSVIGVILTVILAIFLFKACNSANNAINAGSGAGGHVTLSVTGTGPADVTWGTLSSTSQDTNAGLPDSETLPGGSIGGFTIVAQDGSGSGAATVSCSITGNGINVSNTSSGAYAVVDCSS